MNYGGVILLPVSIFQLRRLVPGERLVLLLNAEAKKALNASVFCSSFVITSSPPSEKSMEILLRLPFAANVSIETFLIVFYDSRQIKC